MNRTLKYALLTLLWAAVAGYMLWAAAAARRARKARTVARMEIEVVDSTSQGHLVSAAMVRGWISDSGIPTIGTAVDEVDLSGIETLIARNGFVTRRWPMLITVRCCISGSASASRSCGC